jgi:hypothetical protein
MLRKYSMAKKRTNGIKDPWRLYEGNRHKEKDTPTGATGSTHPLDVDLLPHKQYVFRHPRATGDLLIQGADNKEDAAAHLLAVIYKVKAFRNLLERMEFIYGIEDGAKGFIIKAGKYVLYLPNAKGVADGLSRLVMAIQHSVLKEQLEKEGIIPLLK